MRLDGALASQLEEGLALKDAAAKLLQFLTQGVSVQDAFLSLYEFIETSPNGCFGWVVLGKSSVYGVKTDSEIVRWRNTLRSAIEMEEKPSFIQEIAEVGAAIASVAAHGMINAEISQSLVIALRVLDNAFQGTNLAELEDASDSLGYVKMRSNLRAGKPLFEGFGRRAYPRPVRHSYPEVRGQNGIYQLLDVLTVIREDENVKVDIRPHLSTTRDSPGGFRTIAIIPTIHCAEELTWSLVGEDRYSVVEHEQNHLVLERTCVALEAVLDQGADLVLLPELVSGPELIDALVQRLEARALRNASIPTLVLAGTHMARGSKGHPRNRAVVLNGDGGEAWYQDKMHAYEFSVKEQEAVGYPLGEINLADRLEAIEVEPRTVVVVDISPSQRLAVLTCEDLIQDWPQKRVMMELQVTTLLVPVMAGRRPDADDWIDQGIMNYVRHPGAAGIMANSAALVLAGEQDKARHFAEIRAAPRLSPPSWEPVHDPSGRGPPIGWLVTLDRGV